MARHHTFHPLTVGYDWEMAVITKTTESAGEDEIMKIANEIRRKLPWARAGIDIDLLELRMDVAYGWQEFKEKNRILIDCARKIAAKKNYQIIPIGARPTEHMPIGSHIHIGTAPDFTQAIRITNAMIPYVPCLIALACNSPFSRLSIEEFKSYRIMYNAEWCSFPIEQRLTRAARGGWGEDVQVRLPGKPTIEIRCLDSSSCISLMEEYVALLTGLLYGIMRRRPRRTKEKDSAALHSLNRFRAAKDGLQAVLHWHGEEKGVTEIFKEIFSIADEGMRKFGACVDDLKTIMTMLKKRQTQADFLNLFISIDSDPSSLFRSIANVLADDCAFHTYLKKARTLPKGKSFTLGEYVLSWITKDVPYFNLYLLTPLPPYYLNQLLRRLKREGKITSRISPYEGYLFTRTDLA